MTTISLKLPDHVASRLNTAARARKSTPARLAREVIENSLPVARPPLDLPKLPPGESAYDKMLPILKKAWKRNRGLPRDLATNPKYMEGFGQ